MNEQTEIPARPPEDPERAEGPGKALRRAREARGLTVGDIARALHLDPWMIEALENDDFDALGAPVFAKGHLRQYGAQVGLESDDLMIAYYRVCGRNDAPPPPITATMAQPDTRRGRFLSGIVLATVVVLALATLLWYLAGGAPWSSGPFVPAERSAEEDSGRSPVPEREDPLAPAISGSEAGPPAVESEPVPGEPAEQVAVGVAAPAGEPATVSVEEPEAGAGPAVGAATAVEAPPATADAAVAADVVRLDLRFAGESWVEVYGADGARLLYAMMGAGDARTVAGRPPLEVYLGRARDVTVTVDGAPFDIPADSIRGNTARFRIEPAR